MNFWLKGKENLYMLIVEPGKTPRPICVAHSTETLQQLVGGELGIFRTYPDGAALVCNRRGKSDGLPPNRRISKGRYIAGTFFICALKKQGFASLSLRQQDTYLQQFAIPDKFMIINNRVCCYPEDAIPEIFRMWNDMDGSELAVLGKIKLSM